MLFARRSDSLCKLRVRRKRLSRVGIGKREEERIARGGERVESCVSLVYIYIYQLVSLSKKNPERQCFSIPSHAQVELAALFQVEKKKLGGVSEKKSYLCKI